jgi:hypothetical protein
MFEEMQRELSAGFGHNVGNRVGRRSSLEYLPDNCRGNRADSVRLQPLQNGQCSWPSMHFSPGRRGGPGNRVRNAAPVTAPISAALVDVDENGDGTMRQLGAWAASSGQSEAFQGPRAMAQSAVINGSRSIQTPARVVKGGGVGASTASATSSSRGHTRRVSSTSISSPAAAVNTAEYDHKVTRDNDGNDEDGE